MLSIDDIVFNPADGLVPAVIQNAGTGQVLMLGYMNREALQTTLDTGKVTFFSRSKKRLWMKGESSGNVLNVVRIQKDCDNDALLVEADPAGPTCHTGETSCFHEFEYEPGGDLTFLNELQELLYDRREKLPEGSYTSKMFRAGRDKLAQKVGEEAVETVIAAKNSREELTYEASDLLFHLMMLLAGEDMKLEDLVAELKKRHKPG
ncbi:MAG: bifunctional phosphoribosyl-AMP cyclohydrolase/phosphoribosyl-ATP diphosphatase HisIE [Cyclonatronaceae bacterium]